MDISYGINMLCFKGLSDSAKTEEAKHPDILDYDKVVDVIKKHRTENLLSEQDKQNIYSKKEKQSIRIGRMKEFTLEKLRKIHSEHTIDQIVKFHTTKAGKDNSIPFVRIFQLKGKTFGINSYMKEVIATIKEYPNAIAKILLAKDPKTNSRPSLHLSPVIWDDLKNNVLGNVDKEYADIIKQELEPIVPVRKKSKAEESVKRIKPVRKKVPQKGFSSFQNQAEKIGDIKKEKISDLFEYIKEQETTGNVFWFEKPYKNSENPIIFSLFDIKDSQEYKSLFKPLLEIIKQNPFIDLNITDKEGSTLFSRVLKSQNHDILDAVQDKKIIYNPLYDSIAREIKDESFISKLKECNVDFVHIDNTAKEKSFEKMDKIFSDLNSVFFSKEKSGKYIFASVLQTRDESYIFDFWMKYNQFIPSKSAKVINKLIKKI